MRRSTAPRRSRRRAPWALLGLLLLPTPACGPGEGDDPARPDLGGDTTDSFSCYVYRVSDELPLEHMTVIAKFVDDDTIDPQTGQFTVRRTRTGVTDIHGSWNVTVTYTGSGLYACDKVNHEVWFEGTRLHTGSVFLDRHHAHASVGVNVK